MKDHLDWLVHRARGTVPVVVPARAPVIPPGDVSEEDIELPSSTPAQRTGQPQPAPSAKQRSAVDRGREEPSADRVAVAAPVVAEESAATVGPVAVARPSEAASLAEPAKPIADSLGDQPAAPERVSFPGTAEVALSAGPVPATAVSTSARLVGSETVTQGPGSPPPALEVLVPLASVPLAEPEVAGAPPKPPPPPLPPPPTAAVAVPETNRAASAAARHQVVAGVPPQTSTTEPKPAPAAPRREKADPFSTQGLPAAADPAPTTDVHVHIGRIEVRTPQVMSPGAAGRSTASASAPLSLEQYLTRRAGGGEHR